MKKNRQSEDLLTYKDSLSRNYSSGQIKTTNVNVLLNRVRLDKKKTKKKKIIFSLTLISLICVLATYLSI